MKVSIKHILIFALAFFLTGIIGTLTHEGGHIVVARLLGYNTILHYASMNYSSPEKDRLMEIYKEHQDEIIAGVKFEGSEEYELHVKKVSVDSRLITLGGPIQTVLTGTIGLIVLLFRRKKIQQSGMKLWDWFWVLIALFWLREIFNLGSQLYHTLFMSTEYLRGDEAQISRSFGLPQFAVPVIMGILGLIVAVIVIFWVIPSKHRINFITGGILGGASVMIFWMNYIGPWLLP